MIMPSRSCDEICHNVYMQKKLLKLHENAHINLKIIIYVKCGWNIFCVEDAGEVFGVNTTGF